MGAAGAGRALPRTPYGPCRRSGCTAAAGPLGCSPSYRAPTRQEKAFGAGSPWPAPGGRPGNRGQGRAGRAVGWTRTPSGPHAVCRLQSGGLGSGLELLLRGGALPGNPLFPQVGPSWQAGAVVREPPGTPGSRGAPGTETRVPAKTARWRVPAPGGTGVSLQPCPLHHRPRHSQPCSGCGLAVGVAAGQG